MSTVLIYRDSPVLFTFSSEEKNATFILNMCTFLSFTHLLGFYIQHVNLKKIKAGLARWLSG